MLTLPMEMKMERLDASHHNNLLYNNSSLMPSISPGYSSGGDYYDSDGLGGGGYNDMTTFGRMTAAGGEWVRRVRGLVGSERD